MLNLTDFLRPKRLKPPSVSEQASTEASRLQRFQFYHMVHYLLTRGLSQRKIASLLHLHRITVRLFAEADTFPERVPTQSCTNILDAHLPYLHQRWQAGCTNASQLYREIQGRGYLVQVQSRWHAKRAVCEPSSLLNATQLRQRLCAHFDTVPLFNAFHL